MNTKAPPDIDVSRETSERLAAFHDLVLKWNPRINLISKSSAPDLWNRHIWDSAQAYPLGGDWRTWLDIGSGGGFPAVIIAVLAKERNSAGHIIMIESDQRKAAFLRTVIRELNLSASVQVSRVEAAAPVGADVISARALADLTELIGYAERHLNPEGRAVFFKGETWEKEVARAQETWSFSITSHKSKTNPAAAVLEIKEIKRV
ncbi:16S rRNA (guanine(527)-N(7))-methyltransferase RsmG [Roseobacter ponti]|uniref:Ribosomal RNA small subunit methyltransferase G n=1 Tax=Roseobacter ponti TaxID=1891787 RepID=A0A858SLD1_9RHOB|nr:16S rRNA (guanine(527)-N(7))-methyltransferase RsmG [Roseobacter ponti]QJF49729.1 16S rRNA (guanine(527)-N(7))-methyltransferase RsmG [Roseobacter ponti]